MVVFFSKVISLLLHPLLILIYLFLFAISANPYSFGAGHMQDRVILLLFIFFTGLFMPGIAILMMRALNLIPDLVLRGKKDRIFPFIATGIFYLWLLINLWSNPDIPVMFRIGVLGLVIALFLSFFINNFERLSVHAVGSGSLIAFVWIVGMFFALDRFTLPLGSTAVHLDWVILFALVILLGGLTGTARLALRRHDIGELIPGYFIGFTSQWIAFFILNN